MDEVLVGTTHDVVVGNGDGVDTASWCLQDVDTLQGPDVPDLGDGQTTVTQWFWNNHVHTVSKHRDLRKANVRLLAPDAILVTHSPEKVNLYSISLWYCGVTIILLLLLWKFHSTAVFSKKIKQHVAFVISKSIVQVENSFLQPWDNLHSQQIRIVCVST